MTGKPLILPADPKSGFMAHRDEIEAAFRRVLDSGRYILGDEVTAFEREFAAFAGTAEAVGVATGTDALTLSLETLGVGRGDGVATVAHTAIATVMAIETIGAVPVLIDVDDAQGMSPEGLACLFEPDWAGPPIKAILPVHLHGQAVDLDAIMAIADHHGVPVLEDASHAHGATWHGRGIGGIGRMGAFSLYPTKNLGALGDAGIVTTNDPALASRLRGLRQYGWQGQQVSDFVGRCSRLDELQAAILRVGLRHLAEDNLRRQAIAAAYDQGLRGLALAPPARRPGATHVFHQYVIELDARDAVRDRLAAQGVKTLIHYPLPAHLHPALRGRLPMAPGGLPRTEWFAEHILSLPAHPHLSDADVARVIEVLGEALTTRPAAALG